MPCKLCGGTDHQRASSTRCANHVPRQKRRFVDSATESTTYTIKCGLRKFCLDADLRDKINQDVLEISDLAVEASLYVHFYYTRLLRTSIDEFPTTTRLHDFYYHLQGKRQKKELIPLDQEYFKLRNQYLAGRQYDGSHRSFLMGDIIVQHETVMKNCVLVHLFDRMCKYAYRRFEKRISKGIWKIRLEQEVFTTSASVLSEETWLVLNEVDLTKHLGILRDSKLKDKHWWLLVPASYKMGIYFSKKRIKIFQFIPCAKTGPKTY